MPRFRYMRNKRVVRHSLWRPEVFTAIEQQIRTPRAGEVQIKELADGENKFRYESKCQNGRTKKSCIVLGLDNAFTGERKSTGPAGKLETMQRNYDPSCP